MSRILCSEYIFQFQWLANSCTRSSFAALAPALLVGGILITSIPPLRHSLCKLGRPFHNFLSYSEAQAFLPHSARNQEQQVSPWPRILLFSLSLVFSLLWLGYGSFHLLVDSSGARELLLSSSWLYAALRPLIWPTITIPFDLFSFLALQLLCGIIVFSGHVYDLYVYATAFPSSFGTLLYLGNTVAAAILLLVVLNMRFTNNAVKNDYGIDDTPEDQTTLWGWMSFSWVTPLLWTAYSNKTLRQSDVYRISPLIQARPLYSKFSRPPAGLLGRIWQANSRDMLLDVTLTYISVVLSYAGPFFLKHILDALVVTRENSGREARAGAFVYAFAAFACSLLGAQIDLQHLYFGRRAALRVRSELMVAIYDKTLKRKNLSGVVNSGISDLPAKSGSKAATSNADSGKVLSLLSADASLVSNTVSTAHILFGAPFQIIIATLFLYQLLGWSAFAGFAVVLLTLPVNNIMAKRTSAIAKQTSTSRDGRMGVLNELLTAIKFIKFFAWEDRWVKRVLNARAVELHWIKKARINSIMFSFIGHISPVLVSVVSFYMYIAQGNELTIGIAFTALALYAKVREPFNTVNNFVTQLLRAKIALTRIANYLDEDEITPQDSSRVDLPAQSGQEPCLAIINGSFRWNSAAATTNDTPSSASTTFESTPASTARDDFALKNINVVFPEGKLTLISGPTASGKSALLLALLGEMTTLHGQVISPRKSSRTGTNHELPHCMSYAAQTPWLRHQSIRDNVLFGFPYDEDRYNAVIECCALLPDLAMFEDGDATEIGTRGVTLSGGQKARVALARAVYAPTKYVLLDDPLSAVDSHTARFLVERLLRGPLLSGRTVILVTHHIDLVLSTAYYFLRIVNGRIEVQGDVQQLQSHGKIPDTTEDRRLDVNPTDAVELSGISNIDVHTHTGTSSMRSVKKPRTLVEDERRASGRIKWPTYKSYLVASSYWTWAFLCIFVFASQLLSVGEKVWIKIWGEAYGGEAEIDRVLHNGDTGSAQMLLIRAVDHAAIMVFPPAERQPYFYIGVYAAIALSAGLLSVCAAITQYSGGLRASRLMFEQLLINVVRATMRWYDTTPQGRLLNRFSKDIGTIDSSLSQTLQSLHQSLASLIVSLAVITVTFPLFIVPASIIVFFYIHIAAVYRPAGREIRRLEATSRSPIFSSLGEVLDGIVTIRAFSVEMRFLDDFFNKVDVAAQMFHMFWQVNRWLQLQLQVVNASMVLITTLFSLSGYISAGLAGVCITSAMSFTGGVYWMCRNWANLELEFNSVERVVEYFDLPKEPPTHIKDSMLPAYWPSSTSTNEGSLVVVKDLVVKYAPELPQVLCGISFELKARERIGLIGRTGSGKSTLAMSLLRFVEPASGSITIDGIDITSIGLHDLRSRITFIPQDATLFSGTLRENLDPFMEHTDAECLDVLRRVHILSNPQITGTYEGTVHTTDTVTLDTQVSAGGTNFSQGQRQLIALARALLRHSALVILDEATSSIDLETDRKIQKTVREEFQQSTLLTVAHRLRTIADYDRLIVLDKGQVVEFDTPLHLIQKEGGAFRRLCVESGMLGELEEAARAKVNVDI